MMKKIILTLFLLLMATSTVVAQNQFWYKGFHFENISEYNSQGVMLIGASDESLIGKVVIPGKVVVVSVEPSGGSEYETTLPVTRIAASAFSGCATMTEVVIPNSVNTIDDGAFEGCTGLVSATLPRSIKTLGAGLFKDCSSLTTIVWPHSLSAISNNMFYGCTSLRDITFPSSVTLIGASAFAYCTGLTRVVLPNTVQFLDRNVFYCCTGLTSVTLPRGISSLDGTFLGCTGLTTVDIPESVRSLYGTFKGCTGLTSVNIPRLVATIGEETFADCSSLSSIDLPNSLTRIGGRAFSNTALTSVVLPSTVTRIEANAFDGCTRLTSVTSRNLNPPYMANSEGFSSETYGLASLYIPAVSVDKYQNANWWKLFDQVEGREAYNTTYDFVADGLYCLITNGNAVIVTGGNGYDTALTIPSSVTNDGVTYTVTGIAASAFSGSSITSLNLPETLTSIGASAFAGCIGLTSLTIPVNVTSIAQDAFSGLSNLSRIEWNARECWCSGTPYIVYGYGKNYYYDHEFYQQFVYDEVKTRVTEVIIGNQVKVLPAGLAANSQITSIDLPLSLEVIGEDAFYNCALLTAVTIPVNVISIGDHSFCNCDALASLTWNARECPNYGGLYYKVNYDPHTGYSDNTPDGSSPITQITIGNEVELLPDNFARGAFIDSFELPASLQVIGDYAFYNCWNVTNDLILSDAVTQVGAYAFAGCAKINHMTVGQNVSFIGEGAFGDGVDMSSGDYYGGANVPSMSLETLTWNARQCKSSGGLYYSSLEEVRIGDNVEILPDRFCYYANRLNSINLPLSLKEIGDDAFYNCLCFMWLILPPRLTTIGDNAFRYCSNMMRLDLPDSLETIGSGAFSYCGKLEELSIPASVKDIGVGCFRYCYALESIVVDSDNPVYDSRDNCNAAIHTADNALVITCKNTTIPGDITAIADYAFFENNQLTGMEIPESVVSIGRYAFSRCWNLTEIVLPNSVTTLGERAFEWCGRLKSITLSESLTAIQPYTFAYCDSLTGIRIPASVTSIAVNAFNGDNHLTDFVVDSDNPVYDSREDCNALVETATDKLLHGFNNSTLPTTIRAIADSAFYYSAGPTTCKIPDQVETIGDYAFFDCDNTRSVEIGKSVKSIGDYAFFYNSSLSSVTIHNSADTIGEWAFYYCNNLERLQLGNAVKVIKEYAFNSCDKLRSVVIPNSVTTIGGHAFNNCDSLKTVTIGKSVQYIGYNAFWRSGAMPTVNCLALTPPSVDYSIFSSLTLDNGTLYVPQAALEDYKAHSYWSKFKNIVGVPGAGPGDVNGDCVVGIGDATMLIDNLLSGGDLSIYGDVNGDGVISIADITTLIDSLLASEP